MSIDHAALPGRVGELSKGHSHRKTSATLKAKALAEEKEQPLKRHTQTKLSYQQRNKADLASRSDARDRAARKASRRGTVFESFSLGSAFLRVPRSCRHPIKISKQLSLFSDSL